MYYESQSVDEILKCSICRTRFSSVVKLLPECKSSICGQCSEALKQELCGSNSCMFRCKACSEWHMLPASGLDDDVTATRMLKLVPQEKALTERGKALKTLLRDVQDKLNGLKTLDELEEIHTYCDSLEVEIMETVVSAINHLNRVQDGLLKQINEYRSELVHLRERPPKRFKSEDPRTESCRCRTTTRQDFDTLAAQIDHFSQEWNEYFTRISKSASDEEIEKAQNQAREFDLRVSLIKNRVKRDLFNGRFLKFEERNLFGLADGIGALTYDCSSVENQSQDLSKTKTKLLHTYEGEYINQVCVLPCGNLATSDDRTVKIWSQHSGELINIFKERNENFNSIVLLPNGWFASASEDGTVKIWDLYERRLVRSLQGHTKGIFSLHLINNGNLVSCSWDGTVKVWNPYLISNNLVITLTGHEVKFNRTNLGVLSNGFFVTCSSIFNDDEDTLRVWNPKNGCLVKSILTGSNDAYSLIVLSDDSLAVGFYSGAIKIFDLVDDSNSQIWPDCHADGVFALIQLPSGCLVSGGSSTDPSIKMWNTTNGELLRMIETDHTSRIWALSVSKDGRYLASGSSDRTAKLWSIQC